MAEYTEQIEKLLRETTELQLQRSDLAVKIAYISNEIDKLEKLRIESLPNELTEEEEKWLRDELTLVGKLVSSDDVNFGSVDLLDEEPDKMDTRGYFGNKHSNKFSIDIKLSISTEFRAGFTCDITIKTKVSKIEAIVREMFKSSEDEYEEDKEVKLNRRYWPIDWDYHYKVILQNPYVHKED